MPYYKRPDGMIEIELPNGQRLVTAKTEQELQAMNVFPAQMSGGDTPMSTQPVGPRTVQMQPSRMAQQLDRIQAPQFAPGPAPAVRAVQRQLDAQRMPTARFADVREPVEERGPPVRMSQHDTGEAIDYLTPERRAPQKMSRHEGGSTADYEGNGRSPSNEKDQLKDQIKQLEDQLKQARERLSRLSDNE